MNRADLLIEIAREMSLRYDEDIDMMSIVVLPDHITVSITGSNAKGALSVVKEFPDVEYSGTHWVRVGITVGRMFDELRQRLKQGGSSESNG